jgi:VanZ family protein
MSWCVSGNTAALSDVTGRNGLLLLGWVIVTHLFSTDAFSASESSRFIGPILRFFFPDMSAGGIELLHIVIRKAGHVTEYFIMGLLAYRVFRTKAGTIAFVFAAAVANEGHQLWLTSERTGSWMDVGYNLIGGLLAVAVAARIKKLRGREGAGALSGADGVV